jgi:hypothetical protein
MTDPQLDLPRDGASLRPRGFWRLVGRLEHERLEFKRSAHHVRDAIPAMAMSECGVDVGVREILVGRVPLTIVLVPAVRDRIVTTPDGRLLRRVGSSNQPLRGDAVSRFVRAREATR